MQHCTYRDIIRLGEKWRRFTYPRTVLRRIAQRLEKIIDEHLPEGIDGLMLHLEKEIHC